MRRVLLSASIMVATVAGTLAVTPLPAQAHRNDCHTQYICPSDTHRYIWYGDAFGPYSSYNRGYDPYYGYSNYDPYAYYTGYNPNGYYGSDPYGYWGGYPNMGSGGYGWGGWGGYNSYGWGGYNGYNSYAGYTPQWYRYWWNCADIYNAQGYEAYVAYFGGREYRCDPAY